MPLPSHECPVCFREFPSHHLVARTCAHRLCGACAFRLELVWSRPTCPLCRGLYQSSLFRSTTATFVRHRPSIPPSAATEGVTQAVTQAAPWTLRGMCTRDRFVVHRDTLPPTFWWSEDEKGGGGRSITNPLLASLGTATVTATAETSAAVAKLDADHRLYVRVSGGEWLRVGQAKSCATTDVPDLLFFDLGPIWVQSGDERYAYALVPAPLAGVAFETYCEVVAAGHPKTRQETQATSTNASEPVQATV